MNDANAFEPPADADPAPTRWLALVVASVLSFVGSGIPVPGFDPSVDWHTRASLAPIIGGGVVLLLLVRGAGALFSFERTTTAIVFLAVTALWAFRYAADLESLPRTIATPGLGFEVLFVLTMVAGNAIWWWLADQLEPSSLGSGTMLAFGCYIVPTVLARVATQPVEGAPLYDALGLLVLTLLLVAALALRTPAWPLTMGRLVARGPADVLLVPLATARAIILVRYEMGLPATVSLTWVVVATGIVGWAVVTRGTGRSPVIALSGVGIAVVSLLALGMGASTAVGGLPGLLRLHRGSVVIQCDDPSDLFTIEARASGMVVWSRAREDGDQVAIDFVGLLGSPVVGAAVVRPGRISFHPVDETGDDPDHTLVNDCSWGECHPVFVSTPVLDWSTIDFAKAVTFPGRTPYVMLAFTPEGGRRFGEYTSAHVRERFAILLDGVVMSVPVIAEPILGGRASIQMGLSEHPEDDARTLAAVLSTMPLLETCRMVSAE